MIEEIFNSLMKENQKVKVYRVGESVRDSFLNKIPKNYDYLVTKISFIDLMNYLNNYGFVEHIGATFGILKFYFGKNKKAINIVLPRKKISTGIGYRNFKIEFDPNLSIENDLQRQDFTMNAIAYNIKDNCYIDPFLGKNDIKAKCIKHVSKKVFEEDPLRILRAIQFSARLNFIIVPQTLRLMQKSVYLLKYVSPKQIGIELNKLLTAENPSIGFKYLDKIRALEILFPELKECKQIKQTHKGQASTVFDHTLLVIDAAFPDNLKTRWAALYHDLGKSATKKFRNGKQSFIGHEKIGVKIAKKALITWGFSKIFVRDVTHLIKHHMFDAAPKLTPKAVRRLIKKVGAAHIFDLVELRRADRLGTTEKISMWKIDNLINKIKTELAEKPFNIKELKINKNDIMEYTGLLSDLEIELIQQILLYYVLYKNVLNSKSNLLLHIPYPKKNTPEYCPHGTNFRLQKILEALTSEETYSWDCGAACNYICENKY